MYLASRNFIVKPYEIPDSKIIFDEQNIVKNKRQQYSSIQPFEPLIKALIIAVFEYLNAREQARLEAVSRWFTTAPLKLVHIDGYGDDLRICQRLLVKYRNVQGVALRTSLAYGKAWKERQVSAIFSTMLQYNKGVQVLTLAGVYSEQIWSQLHSFSNLTHLHLKSHISGDCTNNISYLLRINLPQLLHLEISQDLLLQDISGLSNLQQLRYLRLQGRYHHEVFGSSVRHIDDCLENIGNLTNLCTLNIINYSGLGITDVGVTHLFRLVNLESFLLTNVSITDCSLLTISKWERLQELSISELKLTTEGFCNLATHLPLLLLLDLAKSTITDQGLQTLTKLTRLEGLNLGKCRELTSDSFNHLAQMPSLRRLSIANTKLKMGLPLINALWRLEKFQACALENNDLFYLSTLTNLRSLDIGDSVELTSEGYHHLKSLTKMCVLYRPIPEGVNYRNKNIATLQHIKNLNIILGPSYVGSFEWLKTHL